MRILIFLAVSVLSLAGCTSKTAPSVDNPSTTTGPSYSETIASASSKIKNTPEFEQCMKPNVEMCINMVGNQLAQSQKSVEFCDELTQTESKEACKYGIISMQSNEQKNIGLCDTLSETYKRECRISYLAGEASVSADITKCDALKAEMIVTSGEVAMPFDRSEQCKADIIMRKTDAKTADCAILTSPMKDMCENMIESRARNSAIPDNE